MSSARSWPSHELVMLAGLLSEGNTCHPSCLYFFGNDHALVEDFARAAGQFPHSVARIDERGDGRLEVCVSTGVDARFGKGHVPWNARRTQGALALELPVEEPIPRRSGAFEWARGLDILGRKATAKRVPDEVFGLRDDDLALFVGRLWAGDGFIANATQHTPFYATSSEKLAYDVRLLLLRLGIVSGVHRKVFKYRGGEKPGFTVHLVGETSIETFLERIAPHCVGRDTAVAFLEEHVAETERGKTSKDTIPPEVRAWVDEERRRAGLTWTALEERSGVSMKDFLGRGAVTKKGFRRATIAKLAAFFDSERLGDLASSDVFWDRIVAIEPRGVEQTYDLTVDIDHNFVADGLVVHNSHSAAYALLTYQTAWMKAHYPVEFLCALMTADRDKTEKVTRIIAEGRAWGVEILPPEINQSKTDFTVVYAKPSAGGAPAMKKARKGGVRKKDPFDPKIRFGMGAIRGVGESALEAILEARDAGGAFADLFDFAQRIDARRVNKGVLEALVQCGAFDATLGPRGVSRARAFAAIDRALERSRSASKDREAGQTSLFAMFTQAEASPTGRSDEYPECEPWDLRETLVREKQSLGFYVSGHPLDRYGVELGRFDVVATSALAAMEPWSRVRAGGMVEGYRERIFKGGGGKVAFFFLEDTTGRVEVKVRQNQIDTYAHVLTGGEPVLVSGKVSFPMTEEGAEDDNAAPKEPTLLLDEAVPLADAIRAETKGVSIKLQAARTERAQLGKLGDVLRDSPGSCPVQLVIQLDDGAEAVLSLGRDLRVEPTDQMLARLEKLFGEKVAELR